LIADCGMAIAVFNSELQTPHSKLQKFFDILVRKLVKLINSRK